MRKPVFGVSKVQPKLDLQKMARGLKFPKSEVEGVHYLCRVIVQLICAFVLYMQESHDAAHI